MKSSMKDIIEDIWVPTPTEAKLTFSRCDMCEKPYEAYESEIENPTQFLKKN